MFRKELLDRLESHLQPDDMPATPRTVSLYGPRGIGKTQLAVKFANEYMAYYDSIFYLNAESGRALSKSISACSCALGLESGRDQGAHIRAFNWWLATETIESMYSDAGSEWCVY